MSSTGDQLFLALGSSIGDRRATLEEAVRRLTRGGQLRLHRTSALYDTEPEGDAARCRFLNAVIATETDLAPRALLSHLQDIENELGRVRLVPQGDRTLDIDVILWGKRVLTDPSLTVPHPAMHLRRFVLEPLCDLAPNAIHPQLGKTALSLLESLPPSPPNRCRRVAPMPADGQWPERSGKPFRFPPG